MHLPHQRLYHRGRFCGHQGSTLQVQAQDPDSQAPPYVIGWGGLRFIIRLGRSLTLGWLRASRGASRLSGNSSSGSARASVQIRRDRQSIQATLSPPASRATYSHRGVPLPSVWSYPWGGGNLWGGDAAATTSRQRPILHEGWTPQDVALRRATQEEDPEPGNWEKAVVVIQAAFRGG